jgi:hypothetical protein
MNKLFILRDRENAEFLWVFLRRNWQHAADSGKPLAVQITDAKAKRSSQANRRYWAILNQISEEGWIEGWQYAAEIWADFFKRRFIGIIDLPGGGSMAESSAKLNQAEFAQYVLHVETFASCELGLTLVEDIGPMGGFRRKGPRF